MLVSEALATAVAATGSEAAFGLIGSGNFRLVNSLHSADVAYHAATHEAGAVAMADGYARTSGRTGVATVHQGPGFTNTLTALTEAVKSRTPLVLLVPEGSGDGHANQALDQDALARAIGARVVRLDDPSAIAVVVDQAFSHAAKERVPVVLVQPVELLERPHRTDDTRNPPSARREPAPAPGSSASLAALAEDVVAATRPLIVAGRGAVSAQAGPALQRLAERAGALLATTVVAKGLFTGDRFDIGFLGGLASPLATALALEADLVVAFGTSLDPWTTCGGRIPGPQAKVAVVDDDPHALTRHPAAWQQILGDASATADALTKVLEGRDLSPGWRTSALEERIARYRRADEIPSAPTRLLDPRRLAVELDRRLPRDRIVALDSGHFLAFPTIYLASPDGRSFLFAQGFQSVGLGLGIGIGAAVGCPDRVVAVMMGDGGAKMSLLELDTAVRHDLPLAVVIFDDGGYGAEVHDFEPLGVPTDLARFPCRDYAALARGLGASGVTVRSLEDLAALTGWLHQREGPIVLDCKVDPEVDAVSVLTKMGAAEWSHGPNHRQDN